MTRQRKTVAVSPLPPPSFPPSFAFRRRWLLLGSSRRALISVFICCRSALRLLPYIYNFFSLIFFFFCLTTLTALRMLTGAQGRPVTWPAADWGGGGKRKTWRRRCDSVRPPMLRVLLCVGLTQFHPTALLPHYLRLLFFTTVFFLFIFVYVNKGSVHVFWRPPSV